MDFMKNMLPCRYLLIAMLAVLLMQTIILPGTAEERRVFVDSAGRQVILPASVNRIAPSGQLAQIVLYSLCPLKLIGWSSKPGDALKTYLPEPMQNLPVFGQFYGRNVSLNLEALIAAKPDVIIDIGERKAAIREDMDSISAQTGIPVVFIEATLDTMGKAYEMLGSLTGMESKAGELASYARETVEEAKRSSSAIGYEKRVHVYYAEGNNGLMTDPSGSIHADVIDLVGAVNVADIALGGGAGMNPVSMEQVMLWQPDVILFAPGSAYEAAAADPLWQELTAMKKGRYYEIPGEPYNWLGRPPAVNRLLGVKWLGSLLYPDVYKYDMVAEAQKFFKLFYHYDLSYEQAEKLMEHSTIRR